MEKVINKIEYIKADDLTLLHNNPRTISDKELEKLSKKLEKLPSLFEKRPLLVNKLNNELIVYAGNQRLKAAKKLGLDKVPCIVSEISEELMRDEAVVDNTQAGEWELDHPDWQEEFVKWELIGFDVDNEDLSDDFSLKDGDRAGFQQMTFTLSDEQIDIVKGSIAKIKKMEEFKHVETFGNENSNGNALYLITRQWEEQEK